MKKDAIHDVELGQTKFFNSSLQSSPGKSQFFGSPGDVAFM